MLAAQRAAARRLRAPFGLSAMTAVNQQAGVWATSPAADLALARALHLETGASSSSHNPKAADIGPQHAAKSQRQLPTSPWMLQFSSHLASEAVHAAANSAKCQVSAAYSVNTEAHLVEEWLAELHSLPADTRSVCAGLLSRHPSLLYAQDPRRITATVQVLADSIRDKGLMRPWFFSDKLVLQLVDRYTSEALRARLSKLHADVWAHLDDETLVYTTQCPSGRSHQLDLLDLDARALAAKAHKLRGLVPHMAPSTMLRAVPELQDVEPEELPRVVQCAGLLVAVAPNPATARLLALRVLPNNTVQVVKRRLPQPGALRAGSSTSTTDAFYSYDAESAHEEPGYVIATLPNARCIVHIDSSLQLDVRFEAVGESNTAAAPVAAAAASSQLQQQVLRVEEEQEQVYVSPPISRRIVIRDDDDMMTLRTARLAYAMA